MLSICYCCHGFCASVFSQLTFKLAIISFHVTIHRARAHLSLGFPLHNNRITLILNMCNIYDFKSVWSQHFFEQIEITLYMPHTTRHSPKRCLQVFVPGRTLKVYICRWPLKSKFIKVKLNAKAQLDSSDLSINFLQIFTAIQAGLPGFQCYNVKIQKTRSKGQMKTGFWNEGDLSSGPYWKLCFCNKKYKCNKIVFNLDFDIWKRI